MGNYGGCRGARSLTGQSGGRADGRYSRDQGNVHSRRVLGFVALGAVVTAAISFAVVDVSIARANGCVGSAVPCADTSVPVVAITFAALGVLSLLCSIVPAVTWFVQDLPAADAEGDDPDEVAVADARLVMARRRPIEDEL